MAKKKTKAQKKIATVMGEFKEGDLPIGKSKKKVKSRKQAIAIALSESRKVGKVGKVSKKKKVKKKAKKKKAKKKK